MQHADSRLPGGIHASGRVCGFTRKDWMKGRTVLDQIATFVVGCNRHALAFEVRTPSVIFRQHLDDHRDYVGFELPRAWTLELEDDLRDSLVREPTFSRPKTHDQIILLTGGGNPIDPSYRAFRPEIGDAIVRIFEALRGPEAAEAAGRAPAQV